MKSCCQDEESPSLHSATPSPLLTGERVLAVKRRILHPDAAGLKNGFGYGNVKVKVKVYTVSIQGEFVLRESNLLKQHQKDFAHFQ